MDLNMQPLLQDCNALLAELWSNVDEHKERTFIVTVDCISSKLYYTSTKSWRGYIFTSVCLCVCVSVCVSVCLCVRHFL